MSAVPESVVSTVKDRLPFRAGAQGFFFEDQCWDQREYRAAMEAMCLQLGVSLINQLILNRSLQLRRNTSKASSR